MLLIPPRCHPCAAPPPSSSVLPQPRPRLTNTQYSMDELSAIVQEAQAAGTYVAAHAYTPPAIRRALAAGVRSIEHGNWLDGETAQMMAGVCNGASHRVVLLFWLVFRLSAGMQGTSYLPSPVGLRWLSPSRPAFPSSQLIHSSGEGKGGLCFVCLCPSVSCSGSGTLLVLLLFWFCKKGSAQHSCRNPAVYQEDNAVLCRAVLCSHRYLLGAHHNHLRRPAA